MNGNQPILPGQEQQSLPGTIMEREMVAAQQDQINSELFRLKLVTEETLQDIENNLRGVDWDAQRGEWHVVREPLMNDKGINAIMTNIVKPTVCKEIMLSHLEEQYIENMAIQFEDNLADLLFANFDEFELHSKQNMNNIVDWVGNMVYCALRRALKGGERTSLRGSEVREIMTQQTMMPGKRPGLFGGLFKK